MNNGLPFISNITPCNPGEIIAVANSIRNAAINPINKIYVSVGGKYNARSVQIGSEATLIPTNSLFQMFPQFLQTREPDPNDQCLIIVIDDFHNVQNLADNNALLHTHKTPNTYIILCNMLCTKTFMTSFMEDLLEFVRQVNVSNTNFMICNYIKFLNAPNEIERRSATSIPDAIQRVLNLEPNALYSGCFYDWFGYNNHLYNYIYCYKLYRHNFIILQRLEQIIEHVLEVVAYSRGCNLFFIISPGNKTIFYFYIFLCRFDLLLVDTMHNHNDTYKSKEQHDLFHLYKKHILYSLGKILIAIGLHISWSRLCNRFLAQLYLGPCIRLLNLLDHLIGR